MKSTLVLLLALSSASAFTVQPSVRSRAAVSTNAVEGLVGDIAPIGYFDPLGLSKGKTMEEMVTYREAELKHGRAAMVACLGWIVQIFVFVGFLEFLGLKIKNYDTYVPGDLLGASELVDNSDGGWLTYQQKELSNGRLAMCAIMGFWFQDLAFGETGDMLFKPMLN